MPPQVCSFISAARTVARREVQYGQVATSEEVRELSLENRRSIGMSAVK